MATSARNNGTSQGRIAIVVRSTESLATRDEDEQHHAERRMQQADHQVQRHDQAEMDRVDAELQHDRQQDRHQDGDRGDGVDEAADEQDQDVGEQQEHPFVLGDRQHRVGQDLRRLG